MVSVRIENVIFEVYLGRISGNRVKKRRTVQYFGRAPSIMSSLDIKPRRRGRVAVV